VTFSKRQRIEWINQHKTYTYHAHLHENSHSNRLSIQGLKCRVWGLHDTATHCNTLQYTAPHCTILHHTLNKVGILGFKIRVSSAGLSLKQQYYKMNRGCQWKSRARRCWRRPKMATLPPSTHWYRYRTHEMHVYVCVCACVHARAAKEHAAKYWRRWRHT